MTCSPDSMEDLEHVSPFPLKRLVDDLLTVVFEQLINISTDSLKACSIVCHRFYRLAIPILYRKTCLVNYNFNTRILSLLNKQSQLPLFARYAHLSDEISYGKESERFVPFVRAARNLKKLSYMGSFHISPDLLDAIATIPDVVFDVQAELPSKRHQPGYTGWGENLDGMNGFSSPNLHHLQLTLMFMEADEYRLVARCLSRIVTTCPNLRILECLCHIKKVDMDTEPSLDLNLQPSDAPAPLEQLCFVPLSLRTIETWTATTGWNSLTILKVDKLEYLSAFSEHVPSLKLLVIAPFTINFDELEHLQFHAPLRALHLIRMHSLDIPIRFLGQYGPTLEELIILPVLSQLAEPARKPLGSVEGLHTACPHIQSLFLYLRSDINWEYACLGSLSKLQELSRLIILIEHECPHEQKPREEADREVIRDRCLRWFYYLKVIKGGVPLSLLALCNRDALRNTCPDFDTFTHQTAVKCEPNGLHGPPTVILPAPKVKENVSLDIRMRRTAMREGHRDRPFLQMFPAAEIPGDLVWFAKQQGLKWAERQLARERLMTSELLNSSNSTASHQRLQEAAEEGGQRKLHRWMIRKELKFLKRRRDFEEKHGGRIILWDKLYGPKSGKQEWLEQV